MMLKIADRYVYHFELGFVVAIIFGYLFKNPLIGTAASIGLGILAKIAFYYIRGNHTYGRLISVILGAITGGVVLCFQYWDLCHLLLMQK